MKFIEIVTVHKELRLVHVDKIEGIRKYGYEGTSGTEIDIGNGSLASCETYESIIRRLSKITCEVSPCHLDILGVKR